MISEKDWKWFGCAGHFICGQWCRFHLTTQIGNYLISTVGEYVHPRHSQGSENIENKWLKKNWPGEDIGYNRKYETMVFRITNIKCNNEKCGCGIPGIDPSELDFRGYNLAGDAMQGHIEMCYKYAKE